MAEVTNKNTSNIIGITVGVICIAVIIFLIVGIPFGIGFLYNHYNVWSSSMSGQAQLKQADWNRQIIVREASAKEEAATYLAQAEIERAKGVAAANKIIGDSLKGNEDYLRYLYINNLGEDKNNKTIIYIPTEAAMPILEASRLNSPGQSK